MRIRTRHALIGLGAAVVAAVAVPLAAGAAWADDTQAPTQGVDAGAATLGNATASLLDAVNGANRPSGADGLESEFPAPDPTLVEGPAAGLVQNGPFE